MRKDGKRIYTSVAALPVVDEQGNYIEAIGGIQDLTERKQVEQMLAESEQKYRTLAESSLEGIGISKGHQIIFANKALLEMMGYESLDEFSRVPLLDIIAPESKAMVQERVEKRARGESVNPRYQCKFIRKDGQTRDFEVSTAEIVLGGEENVQSTFRDITEQKQAEEVLRESEERYRLLAENVSDVIWTMDINFRYTYLSPSAERQSGYTHEEAMAMTLEETFTPASVEAIQKAFSEGMALEKSG